ncbi:MAG: glycosyl hydrolase [Melioribacteraceae bacterium]
MSVKKMLFLFIMVFIVFSCKEESTPTDTNGTQTINKSSKRGIAFDLSSVKDFEALSSGVSWWYNWGTSSNAKTPISFNKDYQMDFVPMLWGGNTSSTDMAIIKNYFTKHPEVKYLLVMNEPNLTDQANRTPAQAASDWLRYEQVVSELEASGKVVYLVGPAMTWGTMTNLSDPVVWLDAFYLSYKSANNGREPRIDYLAFHWYDYGLNEQLDRLKKYNKKIWVTEMANWNSQINSYAKQIEQMKQMVSICENRDDVFRYAWFYGRGTFPDNHFSYLFTPNDGELSDLGKAYIALSYK